MTRRRPTPGAGRGRRLAAAALLLGLAASTAASAQDAGAPPGAVSAATGRASGLAGARRLDDTALAARRGGSDATSGVQVEGALTGNQASHVTTGSNVIGGGALAGASGVPVVIQNTGNNVLIQSATVVNVVVK